MLPEPDRVTAIIREAAEREILPRFRRLAAHEVGTKDHAGEIVTVADVQAELHLTARLTDLLPGSLAVGEEASHKDPRVLERLSGERPVWILDPVDGTRNFANGNPHFGVIVALAIGGETVMGWIHDPIQDTTALAEAGSGAVEGGRRLRVADPAPLAAMRGSAGHGKTHGLKYRVAKLMRVGSVAHDYLALARGDLHFALYRRLKPWDHAAGVLLHAEAGGHSRLLSGAPYRPLPRQDSLLLAPDAASWEAVRDCEQPSNAG